jgi:hypothetical protein
MNQCVLNESKKGEHYIGPFVVDLLESGIRLLHGLASGQEIGSTRQVASHSFRGSETAFVALFEVGLGDCSGLEFGAPERIGRPLSPRAFGFVERRALSSTAAARSEIRSRAWVAACRTASQFFSFPLREMSSKR